MRKISDRHGMSLVATVIGGMIRWNEKTGEGMNLSRIFRHFMIILLSFQLVSCGTILYPERRNQKVGRVDVGVALLDGFWLLAGLIPGIIAFAVDFSTGAIYLPAKSARGLDYDNIRTVRFDPKTTTPAQIEGIIHQETSRDFSFSDKRLTLSRLENSEEIPVFFEQVQQ